MSGMVAKRLFGLLPQFMPISDKLDLVSSLWEHTQPTSNKTIIVTKENNVEEVHELVRNHFNEVLAPHNIPENFTNRFHWLAGEDSIVKQQLENHFVEMKKKLQDYSSKPIIESFLEKLHSQEVIFTGSHDIKVGGHKLTIQFCNPPKSDLLQELGCMIFVFIIIILLNLM